MLLTKEILRESPFWQEIEQEGKREGEAIGEARGEARGEAIGEARGLADGERRALRRFLTRRFGPLPEWAEQKLTTAGPDTLERWSEQAADAASLPSALD
jgi:predicted transposase YdaD